MKSELEALWFRRAIMARDPGNNRFQIPASFSRVAHRSVGFSPPN